MDLLQDILGAIGGMLAGLPQGLMALTYGFASVPTAFGFAFGAIACLFMGSVIPISYQAETFVLAGTMGKTLQERISMVVFAGITMAILGATGLLSMIVDFAGPTILHGMMAGVGLLLSKIALDMCKKNPIVGYTSLGTGMLVYFFLGQQLIYTALISMLVSNIVAKVTKQNLGGDIAPEKMGKFKLQKLTFNFNVLHGVLALACVTIGTNIAFGTIHANIAGVDANIDHLSIYSGIADALSGMFGGGPVATVITTSASAPNPLRSSVIFMSLMTIVLFAGLLPKIGKFMSSQSVAGLLFVIGAVMTVGGDAPLALAEDPILGGVTMIATVFVDPFIGMIAGIILRFIMAFVGL